MKQVLQVFIRGYAYLISPLTGPCCRFHPTCSAYAMQALDRHGVFKGLFLSLKRILRCHPWYKGVYMDPVPGIDREEIISYKRLNPNSCSSSGPKTKADHAK